MTENESGDPGDGEGVRCWLVEREYTDKGLVTLVYAEPGGERAATMQRSSNMLARTDVTAAPSPTVQTTPMEAGLLLESLYYCTRNGGALRILYPRAITPAKCQNLLATMARSRAHSQLALDLPLGVSVAHEQSQLPAAHSEVAVFYGPRTDFVLAVFLHTPASAAPEDMASTFAQIGNLTYRFFNGD